MKTKKLVTTLAILLGILVVGCNNLNLDPSPSRLNRIVMPLTTKDGNINKSMWASAQVPIVCPSTFAVLAGTTITNAGSSVITGNIGVSPGTTITGLAPTPTHTIVGPGTVASGPGMVNGTIYAGGTDAAQAHADALTAYNYLAALTPNFTYPGLTQLDGLLLEPGIYDFESANLRANGTLLLDFHGNPDAQFILKTRGTLVTMTGSKVRAVNNKYAPCDGSTVYWAVGSTAEINGTEFIGNLIASSSITMASGLNASGRLWALNGAVTMMSDAISFCLCTGIPLVPPPPPAPLPGLCASGITVLAGTTITNDGTSIINGNIAVSPGSAITGFAPSPINTVVGSGTVTGGPGLVTGTIYAGGTIADQAHNDAVSTYNTLAALTPTTSYSTVTQLDGLTLVPGVYHFASSANLQVNGTLYLDFQGNPDAQFIFQTGSTLVTMTGSKVIAINNSTQSCANVYWVVGSSATIDGAQFLGNTIATTSISLTSGVHVSGKLWALNGAVTMITDTISACCTGGTLARPPSNKSDFVTGSGWIETNSDSNGRQRENNNKATFDVSGGFSKGKLWGQLSYDDPGNGVNVESTSVTAYTVINSTTRQIEGIARINGRGSFTYTVVVMDNGESNRNNSFSLELSKGYSASGIVQDGNIQFHKVQFNKEFNKEDDPGKDEGDEHNNSNSNHSNTLSSKIIK